MPTMLRRGLAAFAAFWPAIMCAGLHATDFYVGSSTDFEAAIVGINADPTGNHRIIVQQDFALSAQVRAIEISGSLEVVGDGHTIGGAAAYRPFFIESGSVRLENLTIADARAQGGAGGNGAGGGLGAGAAVFVDDGAQLALKNVQFTSNAAIGGAGGAAGNSGGGGGLGGNGGNGPAAAGGGGGGGLYGNGGTSTAGGGAGGGGEMQNGGSTNAVNGGGGGGVTTAGGNGSAGGAGTGGLAADGSTVVGGNGGNAPGVAGGDGAAGGGGGGGRRAAGGSGGLFGGGGGGAAPFSGTNYDGGLGGRFGGGGGSSTGRGGDGGFGGGGGSGNTAGGSGGFGGGGGGSLGTPGAGGFGGGAGDSSRQGGGGAAFGGALFVATGASIQIEDEVGFTNNTVTGGSSSAAGGGGAAAGNDLFLMGGTQAVFDVASGQTLTFAPAVGNDDGANLGVELDKEGDGTLVLTGTSSFVSTTYLDRGTLIVNGTLGSFDIMSGRISLLNVDDHATLAGTGTIAGYVDNYGRISPGATAGAIGTLRIDGIYLQGSEGIYEVDINAAGQSDRIDVSYAAQLTCGCGPDGGDLFIRAQSGTYVAGTRYTILTTGFGVFDTFGQITVQGLPHFWTAHAEYDAFNAYLVINNDGLTPYARTYNQVQTAAAVMNSIYTTDPSLNQVFNAMDLMTGDGKAAALDQLGGSVFGSLSSVGFQTTSGWLGAVGGRLRPTGSASQAPGIVAAGGPGLNAAADKVDEGLAGGGSLQLVSFEPAAAGSSGAAQGPPLMNVQRRTATSGGNASSRYGWVGGYGTGGDASGNGNAQGLNYGFAGTSFGVDRRLGEGTIFGAAGGYAASRTRTDNGLQSANVDSYQGALYGSRIGDRRYAFNVTSYGRDRYKTDRQLPAGLTAHGEFDGNQFADYLETGLLLGRGAWSWQPSLNVQYVLIQQDAFTESGAGGAGLSVGSRVAHSLRPGLGLRLARPTYWRRVALVPDLHARYAYETLNVDRLVTANFSGVVGGTFTTAGNQLGRNFGQYGFGVNAALSRRFGCYGGYDLMTADRSISHTGSGGLQLRW